jgi:hypothetical protein
VPERKAGRLDQPDFERAESRPNPEEIPMRISNLWLATSLLLGGVGFAAADTIVVTPEEQTAIRDYVVTQKVDPPPGVQITVGATLPDTVEVHALDVPKMKTKYDYVVVGKQTVLVEPKTRKIIQVID